MNESCKFALRIEPAHPALAGHFPGNPVVPGVVLLERVAAACKAWRGARVAQCDAKFMRPLLPGEDAVIELREDGVRVRFSVMDGDDALFARGVLVAAQTHTGEDAA